MSGRRRCWKSQGIAKQSYPGGSTGSGRQRHHYPFVSPVGQGVIRSSGSLRTVQVASADMLPAVTVSVQWADPAPADDVLRWQRPPMTTETDPGVIGTAVTWTGQITVPAYERELKLTGPLAEARHASGRRFRDRWRGTGARRLFGC